MISSCLASMVASEKQRGLFTTCCKQGCSRWRCMGRSSQGLPGATHTSLSLSVLTANGLCVFGSWAFLPRILLKKDISRPNVCDVQEAGLVGIQTMVERVTFSAPYRCQIYGHVLAARRPQTETGYETSANCRLCVMQESTFTQAHTSAFLVETHVGAQCLESATSTTSQSSKCSTTGCWTSVDLGISRCQPAAIESNWPRCVRVCAQLGVCGVSNSKSTFCGARGTSVN
jgi:hypothetical protein